MDPVATAGHGLVVAACAHGVGGSCGRGLRRRREETEPGNEPGRCWPTPHYPIGPRRAAADRSHATTVPGPAVPLISKIRGSRKTGTIRKIKIPNGKWESLTSENCEKLKRFENSENDTIAAATRGLATAAHEHGVVERLPRQQSVGAE